MNSFALRKMGLPFLVSAFLIWIGAIAAPSHGQQTSYPTKFITILVGYTAGGPADLLARTIADAAGKVLGQPVIVVNKPGATASVAVSELVHAKPDGYTLLCTSTSSLTVNYLVGIGKYGYKDIRPMAQIATDTYIVAVGKQGSINNLSDLINLARAGPGKVRYSTIGQYSLADLGLIKFQQQVGIQMTHIPQKGTPPAVAAIMGGHVEMAGVSGGGEIISQHKAGEIKIIAVMSEKRLLYLPEVPTFKEQGIDFVQDYWFGLFGPKNLPESLVGKWNDVLKQLGNDPAFKAAVQKLYLTPSYLDSKDFTAWVAKDGEEHAKTVRQVLSKEKK